MFQREKQVRRWVRVWASQRESRHEMKTGKKIRTWSNRKSRLESKRWFEKGPSKNTLRQDQHVGSAKASGPCFTSLSWETWWIIGLLTAPSFISLVWRVDRLSASCGIRECFLHWGKITWWEDMGGLETASMHSETVLDKTHEAS